MFPDVFVYRRRLPAPPQDGPHVFRTTFHNFGNIALSDNGVWGTRPQAGTHEYFLDILQTNSLSVDGINGLTAGTDKFSFDGKFRELTPYTAKILRVIVKKQLNTGSSRGSSRLTAVEDHIGSFPFRGAY